MNAPPEEHSPAPPRRLRVIVWRDTLAVPGSGPDATESVVRTLREVGAHAIGDPAGRRLEVVVPPADGDGLGDLAGAAEAADAIAVVVDASRGLDAEVLQRLSVAGLLGASRTALVVCGLEAVGDPRERFDAIVAGTRAFAAAIGAQAAECIAAAARRRDIAEARSGALEWYTGPTLLEWLDRAGAPDRQDARASDRGRPAEVADQFEVAVAWVAKDPLLPGRRYRIRIGPETVGATFAHLKYAVDPGTLDHLAARTLGAGAIGVGTLLFDTPIAFEASGRADGDVKGEAGATFIVVDRAGTATLGVGRIRFALRRSHNLAWQATDVDRAARVALHGHRPCVVWFTGLSGAGKSTIANLVEKALHARGCHTYLLDGDNVRHGLNRDLGFTDADRVENVRRVAEVARLMADAGLVVLVSFISPFRAERRMARALVDAGEFCEVFVDVPLEVAEARDVKGLYAKARRGDLPHFTGIDSPYEPPERPDVRIDSAAVDPGHAAQQVVAWLRDAGVFG